MKYYTEPSREIPVAAETEVLVVGGGPAGFGAALHAARMGRKTGSRRRCRIRIDRA